MIKFLIKGLIRDKSRSRLPIIVVTIGVFLTVWMQAYITGFMGETIELNARFTHGHVKVMTRAYAEEMNQLPNDLALLEVSALREELSLLFPGMEWAERIQFGGLLDIPDESGQTRAQGPAVGMGLELLSENTREVKRLEFERVLVRGSLPKEAGEVLISEAFSQKMLVEPGEEITFIGSSMNGSMIMHNFTVAGTLSFGVETLDRGTLIADFEDVRLALELQDAAGEIIGFFGDGFYDDERAYDTIKAFNAGYKDDPDEYAPVMKTLSQQGSMATYVQMADIWAKYISLIFIIAMGLVLWNAGLLGGLRRYGEVGIRLAMGEEKGHIYRSMIYESIIIGIVGSVIGTALGLLLAWYMETHGINIEGMMDGASMMMPNAIRCRITPPAFYLCFIPRVLSTVNGTALSGIGIYKRQTAKLFKELEA